MKRTYYYKDELNDDFAGTDISRKDVKPNYRYIKKNPVWHFFAFILYRFIATPLVSLFQLIVYGLSIKNAKVLRGYRRKGYFLYGNHTLSAGDAFTPSLVAFPKKAYLIANADAVSIPVVGTIVEMLGGMPIPVDYRALKNFNDAVDIRAKKGDVVTIYPEAHIWPYYTHIRPYKDVSFKYPVKTNKPVFCFTSTFQKRFLSKRPRVTVYVDGPFFPDESKSVKENQKLLRDKVYDTMVMRSKNSTVEYVSYIKITDESAMAE